MVTFPLNYIYISPLYVYTYIFPTMQLIYIWTNFQNDIFVQKYTSHNVINTSVTKQRCIHGSDNNVSQVSLSYQHL